MNICKYDIYFIIVLFLFAYLYINQNKTKEGFEVTQDIKDAIKQVYQADIEAIRNLSNIATQLTNNNNLTMPGTLNIAGSLSMSNQKPIIDLGAGDTTREQSSGKIGYNIFEDSLNIVGKGNTPDSRRTTMWDNVKVTRRLSTNNIDPNNIPDGWTGGFRTFDIYAGGTIGCGPDGKQVNSWINTNGNAYFNTKLNIGTNGSFCIGGTCIDESHLKILKGDSPLKLKHVGAGGKLSDPNNNNPYLWVHLPSDSKYTLWTEGAAANFTINKI